MWAGCWLLAAAFHLPHKRLLLLALLLVLRREGRCSRESLATDIMTRSELW